jgi:glycosyltransferase involved in cell wall biosynthesis
MRILLVNYEYPPLGGGAANATMFLGRALVALGHEPLVLTAGSAGLPGDEVEDGVRVVRVAALRKAWDRSNPVEMASFLVAAAWRARSLAREHGTEAVIAFFTLPSGPVAWLLEATQGLPYVVSLRGGDVPGLVARIGWLHSLATPLRRMVLRGARAVVANSESLAELSRRADPVAVQVIPNGVDCDFFRPDGAGPPPGQRLRLIAVGRLLDEHKNVSALLRALGALAPELRDRFTLDVVGDGPDRARLESLAASLGVAGCVAWHGWCDKRLTAGLYRRAACFVNPSRYEGLPNTVLEAMASGLPVIASDVGGNNEAVVQGVTGWLFPLEREGALGECLARLAADEPARHAMGERARERALEHYSWAHVAQAYAALLQPQANPATSPSAETRKCPS